jgi:hypothetical protein
MSSHLAASKDFRLIDVDALAEDRYVDDSEKQVRVSFSSSV